MRWDKLLPRLRGAKEALEYCKEEVEAATEAVTIIANDSHDGLSGAAATAAAHLRSMQARFADQSQIVKSILAEVNRACRLHIFHARRALKNWTALRDDLKVQLNCSFVPQPHRTIMMDPFGMDVIHDSDEML